jgi:hypothetical protein
MSVQNLFFLPGVGQAAIATAIVNNRQWKKASKRSPSSIIAVFHTGDLLFLPQSEIRAGKLLVDPGHLQEERVGGRPHHRYRKAPCHRPVVDRALQKNTHIADDHGKKLPETILFKINSFQVMSPCAFVS